MLKWGLTGCIAGTALAASTLSAAGHFLMIYPGNAARMSGTAVEVLLTFAHPFPGAPIMELKRPNAFYMIRQRGNDAKPEKVDLSGYLEPIEFIGTDEKAAPAFKVKIPRAETRSAGDYVFVIEPQPFYESTEDKYIQQFTKMVMNVGGVPGNWYKDVTLPAEIRPLDKPYATWSGGVFRGVVLSNGKPVPFAEIEVQYVNHDIDPDNRTWTGEPKIKLPHPAFETLSLRADANGGFVVGMPKAGWWGVAALGIGPTTTFKGKKLSQDAVIWVQATDMK